MNTVTSFNITVRQMTKMFLQKLTKMSQLKKKTAADQLVPQQYFLYQG